MAGWPWRTESGPWSRSVSRRASATDPGGEGESGPHRDPSTLDAASPPRDSDESLMERIMGGEEAALAGLVERYWSPLVNYASGIVGRADGAKDVVQDTFIRVWRRRGEWTPGGSVGAYLYRIVRNLALNARRDRATSTRHHEAFGSILLHGSSPPTPDQALEADVLRAEVEAAIDALPERRREVFVLSRFHGLTHREIAEALEISPQTVANQMTSGLAELRGALGHLLE